MTVDIKQRLSLAGEHGDLAKRLGDSEMGLVGPAQGSARVLQKDIRSAETTLSHLSRGITVTPPEVRSKRKAPIEKNIK